ncbi:FISUMP domain-containing protein [Reichenbachiella versicolor]|uniref:FISUMP domain-containing protein n=1 Tax=Reichenbachiella versicolor TaxID=1821036 RepID=UPI0013A59478|nr:FISUMP domain-containing protein [Reichenbachiella versicolor]
MKKVLLLIVVLSLTKVVSAQEVGTFKDPRDGKVYKTTNIKIELEGGIFIEREWFAENLNFETEGSVCYKNYPAYCGKYGRLYNWVDAKTACPEGWHLSTQLEWQELMINYGGYSQAGKELKVGGTSNLNIIMSGFSNVEGQFSDIGKTAHLWDAEIGDKRTAGLISLYGDYDEVAHDVISARNMNSCRCVKDY